MKKYFKIWRQLAALSLGAIMSNRLDSGSYFFGKIIRFAFFLFLIVGIFNRVDTLAGYSKYEAILFYLTFNFVDVFSQIAFRGIYSFGDDVRRGNFDFVLSRPVNKLFLVLSKMTDFLDVVFILPVAGMLVYVIGRMTGSADIFQIISYIFFLTVGCIIVFGIHILVAAFTIRNIENQSFLWLYRDSISIGRFPPEIFPSSLQGFFTFVIPIIIIAAFPVKALLGRLSWPWMIFAFSYAISFFALSLLIWKKSLKKYASASS